MPSHARWPAAGALRSTRWPTRTTSPTPTRSGRAATCHASSTLPRWSRPAFTRPALGLFNAMPGPAAACVAHRAGHADRTGAEEARRDGPGRRRSARSSARPPSRTTSRRRWSAGGASSSIVVLVVGAALLGFSLTRTPGDTSFYLLTFALAAVWAFGARLSGPLHLGCVTFRGRQRRPVITGAVDRRAARCGVHRRRPGGPRDRARPRLHRPGARSTPTTARCGWSCSSR